MVTPLGKMRGPKVQKVYTLIFKRFEHEDMYKKILLNNSMTLSCILSDFLAVDLNLNPNLYIRKMSTARSPPHEKRFNLMK